MKSIYTFLLFVAVAGRFQSNLDTEQRMWQQAGSKEALDAVMRQTTLASAVEHLRNRNSTINLATRSHFLGKSEKDAAAMVANWAAPAGTEGAKKVLTEIIEDTEKKLDKEQNRCNDYDIAQRAIIRGTKDDISNFNAIAAKAREEILDAQSNIDESEREIPQLSKLLAEHEASCAEDIRIIQEQLNLALADVNVMDMILKNTNCKSDGLQYPASFLQCVDTTTGEAFLTFRDSRTRTQVAQLRQKSVRQAVLKSLRRAPHLANASEAFVQVEMGEADEKKQTTTIVSTSMTTTPPANKKKAQSKCAFSNQQNCFLLRDRFMQIQGGLVEKVDKLRTVLNHKQTTCDATSTQYEGEISNFKTQLANAQTKLAASTTKQNNADAGSRLKNAQLDKQRKEHVKEIKACNINIGAFQGDICAVSKIRTQVEMLKSGAIDPKFQVVDCSVSKWKTEQCSISCGGGGIQTVRRAVMTPAKNGGAVCPPLTRTQSCGNIPCPVDCVQSEWTEWSACSAACNGGLRTRNRFIEVDALHGGTPCGEKQIVETCGTGSCDSDCVLAPWSDWSQCSKMCNTGSSERIRSIDTLAKGEGKCAKKADPERFNTRPCNPQACVPASDGPGYLQCNNTKLDVVIVMDASGSLKQQGWDATVAWAKRLVKAFEPSDTRIALQTFSGARSYDQSKKCAANPADFDIFKDCGIVWLEHFLNASADQDKLQAAIDGAIWTRSFTLLSLALGAAEAELAQGRKDANSITIVITDGRPMSKDKTKIAAHSLRTKSRLMFVPVTSFAPIADLKTWASDPVRENVVAVPNWETLELPQTISEVVANVCPTVI